MAVRPRKDARGGLFANADANGDGALDRDELLARANERAAQGIDRMMQRADADGDGLITQAELDALQETRRAQGRAQMFERFDTDGDGSITQAEFDDAVGQFRQRHGGMGRDGGPGQGRWMNRG